MSNGQEAVLPRGKSADARVHTGVRLDTEILERLSANDRSVSDQIRERLERTFAEDDLDSTTRELRAFVANIAGALRADFGCEWHESPRAHEEFAAAVALRIAGYRPPPIEGVGVSDLMNEPAGTIGRMRERDDRRAHAYPKLEAAQKRTARKQGARWAWSIRKGKGEQS